MAKQISFPLRNKTLHSNPYRVANCALWFLKLPHSEAKGLVIFNVNILGGSSSVLELLETIGNSGLDKVALGCGKCNKIFMCNSEYLQ